MIDRVLHKSIAVLVAAQALVVGLQVVGRHILRHPLPWTEEVARLLLVWLMCIGGIAALRHASHPRVTALVRLLAGPRRAAVDRGLRLVLLLFFLGLVGPSYRLTIASAAERLPASGLSGAAISIVLPISLRFSPDLGLSVIPALLAAFLSGSVIGVVILAREGAQGRKKAVPFGVFLAFGGLVGVLAGPELVDLYRDHLLRG